MADSEKLVEDLFEAALARPAEERTAWLNGACPESPEVRELVRMLLVANKRAGDFLESPLFAPSDASSDQAASTFEVGSTVAGRFNLHRFIARGGMGDVYEAWDSELRERVALKTIRPDLAERPQVIERFRREVKQARAISHPNVCRIHELFCHLSRSGAKVWFLSMEFLDGFTLSEHIHHAGSLRPAFTFNLLEQIVGGLNALHAAGVIHRDLKPGNIMLVSGRPGQLRAVITDFGLATNVLRREAGLVEHGGQGTPAYMAPEQRTSADVTSLADQYALGIILCEMLTGSLPARTEVTARRAQLEAKLARTASPLWAHTILRCLEQVPERRFRDLNEIVVALRPAKPHTRVWLAIAAAVALVIGAVLWLRSRPAAPPSTSLAVLPLVNRTGNANLEYLGAGITEALTDDLSRMPGLQVTAGSVARRYQGAEADPRSAGARMQVGSIVSGSVESSGGNLEIPIELIEVRSGKQIWGQTYKGAASGLADIQHEIAVDVAYHLKTIPGPETAAHLDRQYSTNPSAYDAYLKGRFQLAKRTPDGLREAVAEFQRSLTFDPKYAPALAGVADCESLLAFYGLEPSIPLLKNSLRTSQEALEIDSTSAEAYTSRAFARTLLNFDWQGAEQDYKRAIELNPNDLQAHAWYALVLLTPEARDAEARAQMKYVQTADPESPVVIFGLAMLEQYAGRTRHAVALLQPRISGADAFEPFLAILSECYLQQKDGKQAIQLLRSIPVSPEDADARAASFALAYAESGDSAKATQTLGPLLNDVRDGRPLAVSIAKTYTALGDHRKAIDMLQTAFNKRESGILFVNVEPLLAPLRGEPQFQTLLQQINLQ